MNKPNPEQLAKIGTEFAAQVELPPSDESEFAEFFQELLFGERKLWGCFCENIITEFELRNALLARTYTYLENLSAERKIDQTNWDTSAMEARFDHVLFGRDAIATAAERK